MTMSRVVALHHPEATVLQMNTSISGKALQEVYINEIGTLVMKFMGDTELHINSSEDVSVYQYKFVDMGCDTCE